MAFLTGVSTSPSNLLAAIESFATSNGWTINTNSGVGGDPASSQLSIEDSGAVFNFVPDDGNDEIRMQPSTAFINASTQYYAHTGNPAGGSSNVANHVNMTAIPGPHVAYTMFGNTSAPRYIHVVCEVDSGVFSHISFGTITKFGTFTGGAYATALTWNTAAITNVMLPFQLAEISSLGSMWMRADSIFSAGSPGWFGSFGTLTVGTNSNDLVRTLYQGGLNETTQRSVLAPVFAVLQASPTTTPASQQNMPVGVVPDVRFISMEGRLGNDILTLGSDDWYVYPMRVKGSETGNSAYSITGTPPNHTTNLLGIAYRRT